MNLSDLQSRIEDLANQIETEAAKMVASGNLTKLVVFYHTLKEGYDALDTQRKRIYAAVDQLNKDKVPEALEREGTDLVRIPELARSFYIVSKLSVSVVEGQRPRAHEWLRSHGGADLIQETTNAGTLAAWVRQMQQDQNIDPPGDMFTLNPYKTTGSSKYTPKAK